MNGKVASLCYRLLADKLYESNVNNYTVEIIETSFLGPPSQVGFSLLPNQREDRLLMKLFAIKNLSSEYFTNHEILRFPYPHPVAGCLMSRLLIYAGCRARASMSERLRPNGRGLSGELE